MILLSFATAAAFSVLDTCDGTSVHWAGGRTQWTLSIEGLPLERSTVVVANTAAWQQWMQPDSCCAALDVRYAGVGSSWSLVDQQNTVAFASSAWDPVFGAGSTTVAVTVPTYGAASCQIAQVDQLYNAAHFSFDGSTDLELQQIMAHENGHWLGLDHSDAADATMALGGGLAGHEHLRDDDDAAVCDLHPGDCSGIEICDNSIDDDGDGAQDCDDLACIGFGGCACPVATPLAVTDSVKGDTADAVSRTSSYPCAQEGLTGPELVYTVTAPEDGRLHVALTDLTHDLDLMVGVAGGDACLLSTCTTERTGGTNAEHVAVEVTAGRTYTLVVDGREPEGGAFSLSTSFEPVAVASCPIVRSLQCGDRVEGSNVDGGTDVASFGCVDWETPGREAVYAFAPTHDGEVSVQLGTLSADLDLFVTTAPDGGCGDEGCVASSGQVGTVDERLVFEARAGVDYRIIADGFDAATTPFTLTVDCEQAPVPPVPTGCSTAPAAWSGLLVVPLVALARRRAASR